MTQSGKFSLITVLLFSFFLAEGQNKFEDLKDFNFVNYDDNYIHFYNKESGLNEFFSKLDSLLKYKKGKVRILQMGGSHIQAEIWPDEVRMNFLNLSGNMNGGRGFVFPFKLAKTWNPKNFQISYTGDWKSFRNSIKKHQAKWGVSGITVTTKDSISTINIGYHHDSITSYKFNRIKVFHVMDPKSYTIRLISDTPVKIIRNKENGYTEFLLNRETDTLSLRIIKTKNDQTYFTLYGMSLENDDPGIVYTSVGVNGAKTSSFLRNELFVNQLKTIRPDLIIFCIGINDAYYPSFCPECYEKNYDKLISWIKQVNPKTNFLFVTNNDSYYQRKYPNKRVLEAREVMIRLAKKYHGGLWDLFGVMGGLGSIKNWEANGFAKKDKIHFTDKGYQLIGDLMFSALMKAYDDYLNENK